GPEVRRVEERTRGGVSETVTREAQFLQLCDAAKPDDGPQDAQDHRRPPLRLVVGVDIFWDELQTPQRRSFEDLLDALPQPREHLLPFDLDFLDETSAKDKAAPADGVTAVEHLEGESQRQQRGEETLAVLLPQVLGRDKGVDFVLLLAKLSPA